MTERDAEAAALWARLRAADPGAREQLIEHYGELPRIIAAKLFGTRPDDSVAFDDYLQHARVGLLEAIDRFDAERGVSFESFSSHRIRGAVLTGAARDSELRAQVHEWRARIAERRESLKEGAGMDASRMSLEDFARLAIGLAIGVLLEEEGGRIDESVEANPYSATELRDLGRQARELVEQLPARERDIIKEHYFEQREFQELAARMQITKSRVSQLHARALERIREALAEPPKIDQKL